MESYNKCIVAFLDILGFKKIINTKTFDVIRDIFLSIIPENEIVLALGRAAGDTDDDLNRYNDVLSKTKMHVMSDSIVIAAPCGYPEALAVVVDICNVIQEQLYMLDPPVFLRGAIAEGDFYLDNNLIFGKALVDAYIAQENYAVYPRIIVSDYLIAGKCSSVDERRMLSKDDDGYCHINTLEQYFGCETRSQLLDNEKYNKIKKCVDEELGGYSDRRIREKYIWLRKELERIEKKLALNEGKVLLDI